MATERNHLSLSMASTLASSQGSQQPQQPSSHVLQQQPAPNSGAAEGQDNSPGPTKRGPGRPKGSTKKSLESDPSSPPKLKRPVGRPRKDGRPAGSVPKVSRGPGRPRKNFPPDFAVNTFPQQQQQQPQQPQGEQEGWTPLSGMFNNYRLPKEATSDATVPAAVNEAVNAERPNGSSGTAESSSPAQQPSKWFPPSAANAAAASSSSIANALIHPPSMSQSVSHPTENHATSSALVPNGNREHENPINGVTTDTRPNGNASPSIPLPQIASFILLTVYSLFSRHSQRTLPLPVARDVLPAYRAHISHLNGTQAIAYSYLKTFWLPCSPLLFRMVLPRSGSVSKSSHRNPSSSTRSPSSRGATNGTLYANGLSDAQNASRTPTQDQHYESHRFFYWDPFHLSLSGPLACPVCNQATLTHGGSLRTGPLRVFDLPSSSTPATSAHVNAGLVPSTFYVLGMQYVCPEGACAARLASWDPRIVDSLPQVIADEWPVHLASIQTDQTESKGSGLSGDAVSRPLFTLVKTLAQAGTSQEGIRDILAKLWDWSDSDKEDDHEEQSEEEDSSNQEEIEKNNETEKVAEMLFASPYHRLWTAQAEEAAANVALMNGQRPAKRHKPNEPAPGVTAIASAPPNFSSAIFESSGLAIQLQTPSEHLTNGVNNRSPRSQPQQPPQQPPQQTPQQLPQQTPQQPPRLQPPQAQLKPNQSVRPPPGARTSIAHTHTSHIHTPSPIYPSASLPNSTTNSPQTGQGSTLSLKRPLEPETHHPPSGGGPPVSQPSTQSQPQASPAQPQFPQIVHTSPFTHLRGLQQQHPGHPPQHPSQHPPQHPPQHPQQHAPHPQHHHPSTSVRQEPPLHMHPHPSLVHASNGLPRFHPQAALHPHQPMLATAPQQAAPPQAPPHQAPPQQQQQHPTPQRRVRHCVKCGRHDCKGKGGSQFCKNPCKDCGGMDCKGRNSKRPNATCREGW